MLHTKRGPFNPKRALLVLHYNVPGAYIVTQRETCQTTGERYLLAYTNTNNLLHVALPRECLQGSIPSYFIDVRSHKDVQAAFEFSNLLRVPVVIIKNTGHDYKGRSSAPHSLARWTHNLKDIAREPEFVPEGCSTPASGAVALGIGWCAVARRI
ncbi:hypothetical protein BT96DRAFT_1004344 [Gymnopus androsaceus JB14]|uniref:FAD linked oxidase N-terminal domain-containing protein n=1 Tax=Gymnopus androsaceus JB14 TaxID=1447944 RepID=A0A6A4GRI8_9AGAR|nr:hypothetical protein BT96DRAFT_1004344 [Gymnopus androsaceus JB14]